MKIEILKQIIDRLEQEFSHFDVKIRSESFDANGEIESVDFDTAKKEIYISIPDNFIEQFR